MPVLMALSLPAKTMPTRWAPSAVNLMLDTGSCPYSRFTQVEDSTRPPGSDVAAVALAALRAHRWRRAMLRVQATAVNVTGGCA